MKINNQEFKFIRDIEYYEGPILSEYHCEEKVFLFKWVDYNADGNVYVVIESSPSEISDYLNLKISMRQAVKSDAKSTPCLIITVNKGQVVKSEKTIIGTLPEEYLPGADAYYEPTLAP